MVGRNRQNAVRTADSGISSRGKAVLISSRPEPVTDVAPVEAAACTMVMANSASVRWVNSSGSCRCRMIVTSR